MSLANLEMNESATHVLAVDDSAADRNLLRLSLLDSSYCYELECAERLSEGLTKLRKQRTDVVLLDLNLPDSQGKDTIMRVMEHSGRVPVLILTGSNDDGLALEAVRAGAQDYLVKGQLSGWELSRAIRYAIERHRVLMVSRPARRKRSKSAAAIPVSAGSAELISSLPRAGPNADLKRKEWPQPPSARQLSAQGEGCVVKNRQGYLGFVIEARVQAWSDGRFSAEICIEEHGRGNLEEKKFYVPDRFEAPEAAIKVAMQIGRLRIDESVGARRGGAFN